MFKEKNGLNDIDIDSRHLRTIKFYYSPTNAQVVVLTHYSGRVTQICVFNMVKLGTSASSP